jgi:paraquat-inducible protein A
MIEVFMLGIVVTLVKMTSLARVIPEAALFAFGALTLLFAVILALDPRALWEYADRLSYRSTPGDSPLDLLRPILPATTVRPGAAEQPDRTQP